MPPGCRRAISGSRRSVEAVKDGQINSGFVLLGSMRKSGLKMFRDCLASLH